MVIYRKWKPTEIKNNRTSCKRPQKIRSFTLTTELRSTRHEPLGHTATSRKVVGKKVHATIPKGNM